MEENINEDIEDIFSDKINHATQKKKKSGGFQSMGLSYPVLKGILRRGYKVPTPIQRKVIPLILAGHDVVAMARTGSGKTAAFLVPMFEKLKQHSMVGPRALILSPTRELAEQTLKFTKEIGRNIGLKVGLFVGGDSMDQQFSLLHSQLDVIIGTPGRLLHILMETNFSLNAVEYLVFDEADRLFEMGLQAELHEILSKVAEHRQTLLFSATLPKLLVDFAQAGLSNPQLVRLDVESKLSENLRSVYIYSRPGDEKMATLLHLLNHIPEGQLTLVFAATKHHVEFIHEVLTQLGICCTLAYSSLDQEARRLNVEQFKSHKVEVLVATDVAARGIDIPPLDNVINFNFPANPKLYVHRVGRVARAGRSGTAFSILCPDDSAFLLDLHLFLGKPFTFAKQDTGKDIDCIFGTLPQESLNFALSRVQAVYSNNSDLRNLEQVANNAYKNYIKSRPQPSKESVRRMKDLTRFSPPSIHPDFKDENTDQDANVMAEFKRALNRPDKKTIFERGDHSMIAKAEFMKEFRKQCADTISRFHTSKQKTFVPDASNFSSAEANPLPQSNNDEIRAVFGSSGPKPKKTNKKNPTAVKDLLVPYKPKDLHTEIGLGLQKSFYEEASRNVIDLTGDDADFMKKQKAIKRWDHKKRKFVTETGEDFKRKKIKTESGAWIPKSYKTNKYKKWLERTKQGEQQTGEDSDSEFGKMRPGLNKLLKKKGKNSGQPIKSEIRNKEQFLKKRKEKERKMEYQKRRQAMNKRRKGKQK